MKVDQGKYYFLYSFLIWFYYIMIKSVWAVFWNFLKHTPNFNEISPNLHINLKKFQISFYKNTV